MKAFFLILFAIVIAFPTIAYSQCCSMGSPIAGTTNVGIIPENNLRTTVFYRNSSSKEYFLEDEKDVLQGPIKHAYFNYSGIIIGYGINNDISVEAELGYFINKTQDYGSIGKLEGKGLSNLNLSVKYNILNDIDNDIEWTIGVMGKIPLETELQLYKEQILPVDLQAAPRAGGLGILSFLKFGLPSINTNLFMMNRYEWTAEDKHEYQYGPFVSTSVFSSTKIIEHIAGILQLRHEYRGTDLEKGEESVAPTGMNLVFLSPQLSYTFDNFNVSALYDLPIYKNYNKRQFSIDGAFSINISYLLDLN